MSETVKGVLAMVAACIVWGLSPLFYKLLAEVPPLEVLSHRTLWSFLIFGLVLLVQGRLGMLRAALGNWRHLVVIALAGALISLNWFVFILSIQIGHTVEASLGYYVFPLVAVALGFLALGERLDRLKSLAVLIAVLAVVVLTLGLGAAPWIALILSGSFGLYGLIKKSLDLGPVVSVTGEVLLLLPLAIVWLWGVNFAGWTGFVGRSGGFFGPSAGVTALLMLSGLMTATPLILFSYATRRLALATVGLIQYINPTLQFLVATLVFQEVLTIWHAITFALIWIALALYSIAGLRQERSLRRASVRSGTPSTTDM
jgi:chloramphenicol-sensitive protein RarD